MSGPLGSSQWMYSSGGFYPYEIEQSLRLNDDDSAYLSRTPASAGDGGTWTWSGWVKRGNINLGQVLFGCTVTEGVAYTIVNFSAGNTLNLTHVLGGVVQWSITTSAVFRDPSAWYHIVAVADTDNATQVDRIRLYVNGVRQSVTGVTLAALSASSFINSVNAHAIGRYGTSQYFDGYMAEVNFIDGLALDPTSFGEFKSGVWIPKKYTGSYGTNGFYLSFADSANIGDDTSGNGNDWTPSGLASTDVLLDSPTENYCVWNRVSALTTGTLSDGNLSSTGAAIGTFSATDFPSYWEITANAASVVGGVKNEAGTEHTTSIANSKTYGFRLDSDGDLEYRNITDAGSWTSLTTALTGDWFPYAEGGANTLNAGQATLAASPPAGFLALNTANLPAPAIDPAEDDVPADYFGTLLWTGDGTSSRAITGLGFQPDFSWTKIRSQAYDHNLLDSVRGSTNRLISNSTIQELSLPNGILSFDAGGFTVGNYVSVNGSGENIVAWNWLAGNGTASNTDGTITSTVSANQKAGFSIVSYTGTGANATVGHGLGVAPAMIIVKNRDQADAWQVYHAANTVAPETDYLVLNTTAATADAADRWNDTLPTSSVFSLGNGATVNTSTEDYIAYCFAEVEGFSKFGSYTGNDDPDGPFVYLGFRPSLLILKNASAAQPWVMIDSTRSSYNVAANKLYPNASDAENSTSTDNSIDFLSNGFKPRGAALANDATNGPSNTIIYMAFSEAPFKYSNAR